MLGRDSMAGGAPLLVGFQSSLKGKRSRLRAQALDAISRVENALSASADDIISDLKQYPPERPEQVYIRTGRLGRGWQRSKVLHATNDVLIVQIANTAIDNFELRRLKSGAIKSYARKGRFYAVYVQGKWQTDDHRETGWETLEDVQRARAHSQTNKVRAAMRAAFKG